MPMRLVRVAKRSRSLSYRFIIKNRGGLQEEHKGSEEMQLEMRDANGRSKAQLNC